MVASPNEKIRVCFVFDLWRGRAGAELQLLVLLKHIDRTRIEPSVLVIHSGKERILNLPDCPLCCLEMGKLYSSSILTKTRELREYFIQNRIDIIQTLTIDNPMLTFVAAVGKWSGVKKVFGFRVDIGFWLTPWQVRTGKFAHRFFVDNVIANAEACKRSIIKQENVRTENIFIVPNLIETERFVHIPTWTAANAHFPRRVGIVANMKSVKGTDIFIEAASIVLQTHPEVQFDLAGGGKKENYQSLIDKFGIENNVRLLGSQSDIPVILSTFDIAVLSSRSEGLPNVIMEYMAAGRPCVATDVGGCGELIQHEHNGLLVPPENPAALAKGIVELLDHPDRAERFAAAARNSLSEKYEASVLANRWCEIYEQVLKKR